jgi:hypothetical protein
MGKKNRNKTKTKKFVSLNEATHSSTELNKKQKVRKLYRQQQKVIRQLEKKHSSADDGDEIVDGLSIEEEQNAELKNLQEIRPRMSFSQEAIQSSLNESVVQKILNSLPNNKSKLISTLFLSKIDSHKQTTKIKRLVKQIPYQSLKVDIDWLTIDEQREDSCSLITLSEELLKFSRYVSVRKASVFGSLLFFSEWIYLSFD